MLHLLAGMCARCLELDIRRGGSDCRHAHKAGQQPAHHLCQWPEPCRPLAGAPASTASDKHSACLWGHPWPLQEAAADALAKLLGAERSEGDAKGKLDVLQGRLQQSLAEIDALTAAKNRLQDEVWEVRDAFAALSFPQTRLNVKCLQPP